VISIYKEALTMAAFGAAGVAVPFIVQKFVPDTYLIPQLGGFGKTSAVLGIGLGAALMALGLYSMKSGFISHDPRFQYGMMAFGGSAFAGGVITGLVNSGAMSRAFPRTAAVRAVPAGYSQINKRETNIL
jgi:hypothetical protein